MTPSTPLTASEHDAVSATSLRLQLEHAQAARATQARQHDIELELLAQMLRVAEAARG